MQVLELCHKSGLVKLGHVNLDSTKMKVNTLKHKVRTYYGKGISGDKLPQKLRYHESRLQKISETKAALEL